MGDELTYQQIRRDLSLFSDPATPVEFREETGRLFVEMFRSGEERRYFFRSAAGPIDARHNGQTYISLASLLSSTEFADLRRFADTQRRVLQQKSLDSLIDPNGVIDPSGIAEPFDISKARAMFSPSSGEGALKVLLIDGPAGVGKTSLIERLVYERSAEPTLPPILHITSKGRRLSNLPDAIGKTASDIDARFRADQVPVLARLGALQIAIDGFDELVQPDGYGNAWGALKDLVRNIGEGGPLVLAGRDSFFDQQDIQKKFDSFGSKIDLKIVRLSEVLEHVALDWLVTRGWSREDLQASEAQEFFKRSYVRRPFFLSQIADLGGFDNIPAEMGSPQSIIVTRLLDREAKILQSGLSAASDEDIEAALHRLCEELAVDMAERESDSVSLEYVEFTADYVFSDMASDDEKSALLNKVGSLAFLEVVEGGSERKFPHSELQNHFFAAALFNSLAAAEFFPPLRAVLYGADVVEAFAEVMRRAPVEKYNQALNYLLELQISERFSVRLRSNVAALILGAMVRGERLLVPVDLSNSEINEVRVFDQLSPVDLKGSTITRLDARGADLSYVVLESAFVATLLVDETTLFGKSLPNVGTLQVEGQGRISAIHDGELQMEWLTAHSELADNPDDWDRDRELPLVKYFDRICRRFIRQHQIRDNDKDTGSWLLRDHRWSEVRELLGDRLVTMTRDSSGTKDLFYHLVGPEELLVPGADAQARQIRTAVVRLARTEADAGVL